MVEVKFKKLCNPTPQVLCVLHSFLLSDLNIAAKNKVMSATQQPLSFSNPPAPAHKTHQASLTKTRAQAPTMTLFEKLLGSTLVSRRGEVPTEQALERKQVVGLYFTASTCHPCQAFTPILATVHRNMALAAYKHLSMQERMDVVLVSMDRDEFAFHDYLLQTPFLAVPFRRREVAQDLWKRYDVKKIPTLIFVNENGEEIERDGRRFVENHYMDLNKIWQRLDMNLHQQSSTDDGVSMP